jgi:O-antigen/teichoic acid export membrane protein
MMFLSEVGEDSQDRFSRYFILQVILSAPLAISAAVAIEVFLHQWSVGQVLGIVGVIFFLQLQELLRMRFYIDLKAGKVLALDIANHGLRLTLLLLLWWFEFLSVTSAFLVMALAGGITCLPVVRSVTLQPFLTCADAARRSFRYGRWLLLESLAYYLSIPLYIYLSSALLSYEATGGLSAVISLLNMPNVLVQGVMNLAVPMARRKLLDEGYEAWRSQLISTGTMVIMTSICVYVAISSAGSSLLGIVYGSEFEKYGDLLPIVGVCYCFLAVNTVLAAAFRIAHAPQVGAVTKLWSSVITLSVAYPLITLWGVEGAAAGLVVTSVTWVAIYIFYIFRGTLEAAKALEQKFQT